MIVAVSFGAEDGGLLAGVGVLLTFSALLALAETGLVRTSRARALSLVEQHRRGAHSLSRLVSDPEHFLAPVLLLVLICQLVSATLVTFAAERIFGPIGVVIALFFEIIVIFVAAEAIPKHWAVRHADQAALFAAPIVAAISAFPPVRILSRALITVARTLTPGGDDELAPDVTEDELLALADVAVSEDVIESEERALISSIISFGDTIVREVMVPRTDIIAVEQTTPVEVVLERAMTTGLSRIPVYDTSVDDVVAIAYVRDLVRAIREGAASSEVRTIARPANYVPETKRVAPLLREMQARQFHLAVVIDEYGGTAGIVTLEDLIEELVGEIADEFESSEPRIVPLGESEYLVSAKMAIDEVNELLELELPVGDFDTIGGLMLHLLGHVPREGETATTAGETLVAERVQGRRISRVRISPAAPEPADEELAAGVEEAS